MWLMTSQKNFGKRAILKIGESKVSKLTLWKFFWIKFCGTGNACEYSRHPNCNSQTNKYDHGKLFWKSISVATDYGHPEKK